MPDPLAAAKRIVEEGLNVRQAEALAHEEGVPVRKAAEGARRGQGEGPRHGRAGEARQRRARPAVSVNHRDPGGTVQIRYRNLEQLDEVMRRLE